MSDRYVEAATAYDDDTEQDLRPVLICGDCGTPADVCDCR